MSETNGKANPKTGTKTHIIRKRADKKGHRTRFAGYARDGVVYIDGVAVDVHEFVQGKGTLVVEKLQ